MVSASQLGIPVPAVLSRGQELRVIDYNTLELVATANAQGVADALQGGYLQQGHYLRIERIVVLGDSAATPTVTVYEGDSPVPQRGRDWTQLPPGFVAVAEYPSFLTIRPTSCVLVEMTGANSGDVFFVTVQYQLVAKVTGSG